MVVENLTEESFPPEVSAKFSIENGGRAPTGTDMAILGKAMSEKFDLVLEITSDIETVISAVSRGGMAIANTKGGSNGLFSTSGHYVVLAEFQNSEFTVLDPNLYSGKFETKARKGKVRLEGNMIYTSKDNVASDCKKYYIFRKK